MIAQSHRNVIVAAIAVCVLITLGFNLDRLQRTSLGSKLGSITLHFPKTPSATTSSDGHLPSPVALYFDQLFGEDPASYEFPALREQCDRATWIEKEDVYLQCGNMYAGMTSIMSEVKTCFKMAVEAGTGIIIPIIPLRNSTDLKDFNIGNADAYFPYDQWFDAQHLKEGLARACPRMKVLHPGSLKTEQADKVTIKNQWEIDIMTAPRYHQYTSHFWTGNPFSTFFDSEFARLQKESNADSGEGITVINIDAIFLLFRITDDPTGGDLAIWNDIGMLIRFLDKPRNIISNLLVETNGRPFYGVHFRVENDTVWQSLDDQLAHDLDAVDKAWSMYGEDSSTSEKPLIYIACGDEKQMQAFIEGGQARGWEVTHKWDLARQSPNPETVRMIDELAFDFQGAVDMGMMIYSHFFIGISGSAFSNTIAHARDITGRYRGSSLREKYDDEGARSHLDHDGQASSYPCCL